MSSRNCLRLPLLSALLLQLVLSPPTASFSLSPRRCWTPLRAAGCAYDDIFEDPEESERRKVPPSSSSSSTFEPFERVVKSVTGNENYRFGDITRSVVNTTTHGVEDAVRAVTRNEEYQFGDITRDITKKAIGSTTGGFEGLVKSVTGNENYRFGDLTRGTLKAADGVLTYSEKTLGLMREHNIHEAVELLNYYWTRSMNYEERKEAFVVLVYLGAILVLAYNFVSNVMSGLVFSAAWTMQSASTGTSPLANSGMWAAFLQKKAGLDLFFGGPCLPLRAIVTIPWFFRYRKMVVGMATASPLRKKFPTLNRCLSLLLSWAVFNLAFVGGVTFSLLKLLSLRTGVHVLP